MTEETHGQTQQSRQRDQGGTRGGIAASLNPDGDGREDEGNLRDITYNSSRANAVVN